MKLEEKIFLSQNLVAPSAALKRPLVMTNGVFDILHRGHVSYLQKASELGNSLLVAINSDKSARMLGKGADRPLNAAENRAFVLAGLGSVSMVTFFDTLTPVELMRTVRPDIYVKGGDYDMEKLEETHLIRSWGGTSIVIPFIDGFSTTALVERIRNQDQKKCKAVFLDRDGVINIDKKYVGRWEDFEFVSGAVEGMQLLQSAGYIIVVVTNQSGIARGYYTEEQYQFLTKRMLETLAKKGVHLSGVYYCPHYPMGIVEEYRVSCSCRKPEPGLILEAATDLNISLKDSFLVGDKPSDIQAARAAGISIAYSVSSDNFATKESTQADAHFDNLLTCSKYIVENF